MVWVGRELKSHAVLHLTPDQVAPSTIQTEIIFFFSPAVQLETSHPSLSLLSHLLSALIKLLLEAKDDPDTSVITLYR